MVTTPLLCNTRMRGLVSTACGEMRRGWRGTGRDHAGGGLLGWVGPCFYPMDGAVGDHEVDGGISGIIITSTCVNIERWWPFGAFGLTVAMDRDALGDWNPPWSSAIALLAVPIIAGKQGQVMIH